ncbi:MAG: hypothetical protein AB7G15_09495 [Alphaproteobacteria bacterium]
MAVHIRRGAIATGPDGTIQIYFFCQLELAQAKTNPNIVKVPITKLKKSTSPPVISTSVRMTIEGYESARRISLI